MKQAWYADFHSFFESVHGQDLGGRGGDDERVFQHCLCEALEVIRKDDEIRERFLKANNKTKALVWKIIAARLWLKYKDIGFIGFVNWWMDDNRRL